MDFDKTMSFNFEKEKNAEALQEKYEDLGYDVFIDTYYQ